MASSGFFELQTAMDLLHKLEWDYAQLQQDPENVYFAYNFVVTAENMGLQEHLPENVRLEWITDWLIVPSAVKTAA